MSESIPRELLNLLQRLGLAEPGALRAVEGRVRRMGRDLPQFQSIWVDALLQARVFSPYQAGEINAGRGENLRLGPYALIGKLTSLGYAKRFTARHVESHDRAELLVLDGLDENGFDRLKTLTSRAPELAVDGLAPLFQSGRDEERIWAAIRAESGHTAGEHLIHHGRMPPVVVLEIARQMAATLMHLEQAGLAHGDISAKTLLLGKSGRVQLLAPGLRTIARPSEGFAHAELAPEYYDSIAPEQIDGGATADAATDLYGCGCLWWQLLTGRPCFAGGDSLGKLRAHLSDEPTDVRDLAPDSPGELSAAVSSCLARDRKDRPGSASELVEQLGRSTSAGRSELARWVNPSSRAPQIHIPASRPVASKPAAWPVVAVATTLVGFIAVLWAIGLPGTGNGNVTVASRPSSDELPESKPDASVPESSLANQRPAPAAATPTRPKELVLSADEPARFEAIQLADGMRVCSPPDRRARVLVRGAAAVVEYEDILFDRIDFVWQEGMRRNPGGSTSALLEVRSGTARFRNCTFQSTGQAQRACAAIRWVFPVDRGGLALPTGRLSLTDCVFNRVDAVVDARTAAALTIEVENLLHLGPGPLVRLDHTPPVEEPLGLTLRNVTLRGGSSVLEVHDSGTIDRPGTISVNARLCIFAPKTGGSLLSFVGPSEPAAPAKAVYWTGEGALVTPEAPIAQWRDLSGVTLELNDAALSIAGLVRSRVEFAGAADSVVASNVALRWQAPLPTADAPGIRAESLPEPVR